ncbi:hypothetical protein DL768_006883 [Monosporascus sp. mg162]|nr:hypothetical protein DL768_006883 [Monosporascus sp. mg162]
MSPFKVTPDVILPRKPRPSAPSERIEIAQEGVPQRIPVLPEVLCIKIMDEALAIERPETPIAKTICRKTKGRPPRDLLEQSGQVVTDLLEIGLRTGRNSRGRRKPSASEVSIQDRDGAARHRTGHGLGNPVAQNGVRVTPSPHLGLFMNRRTEPTPNPSVRFTLPHSKLPDSQHDEPQERGGERAQDAAAPLAGVCA